MGNNRKIYTNALVYSVAGEDWTTNTHEAIVTEEKKIIFIGSNSEARQLHRPGDKLIDVKGSVILPGFHDVHMHPMEAMSEAGGTHILNIHHDLETQGRKIRKREADTRKGVHKEWVLGYGHSIEKVLDHLDKTKNPKSRDPRYILDEALPNRPAIFMEQTSHSMWVNSLALERAGITAQSGDVVGGVVWRNPENGNDPNGILLENAGEYIMSIAMTPTPEIYRANYKGLKRALEYISSQGITSVVDARVYVDRENHQVWWDLYRQEPSAFTVRAILDLWAAPEVDDETQLERLKALYSNDEDSLLRVSQIKVYIDGLLESTTAAVLKPYQINLGLPVLKEENKGLNYFTQDRLIKYMKELQNFENGTKGFDFHVHAIGDRGVREVLNAIEASRPFQSTSRPSRHRLTHLELVNPEDYPRFNQLGAIADFQVAGDFALPTEENVTFFSSLVGSERTLKYIPVADVVAAGAHVTLSSDFDVSPMNPFIGLAHAINRGDQSVSIKQAVEMYTINGAYVMRQEHKVGSLEVGKEADFIIIDEDIVNRTHRLEKTTVLQTVLRGKTVHMHPDVKNCNGEHDRIVSRLVALLWTTTKQNGNKLINLIYRSSFIEIKIKTDINNNTKSTKDYGV